MLRSTVDEEIEDELLDVRGRGAGGRYGGAINELERREGRAADPKIALPQRGRQAFPRALGCGRMEGKNTCAVGKKEVEPPSNFLPLHIHHPSTIRSSSAPPPRPRACKSEN